VRDLRQKPQEKERDVLAPLPEAGHPDRHHVQPVEQIGAEPSLRGGGAEVLLGRRDEAHVERDASFEPSRVTSRFCTTCRSLA
jgi:hypothetical protein